MRDMILLNRVLAGLLLCVLLLPAAYCRAGEKEADEWAAQLIAHSGFDIYAAVNLWPWLEELYGPVPNASNHLSYKERSKIYEAAGRYVEQ